MAKLTTNEEKVLRAIRAAKNKKKAAEMAFKAAVKVVATETYIEVLDEKQHHKKGYNKQPQRAKKT